MVNTELANTAAEQGRDYVKQALAFQPVEVSRAAAVGGHTAAVSVGCVPAAAGRATDLEHLSTKGAAENRLPATVGIMRFIRGSLMVCCTAALLSVCTVLLLVFVCCLLSQVIGDMAAPPALPLGAVILYTACLRAGDLGLPRGADASPTQPSCKSNS
jgi:hypothetical protein